MSADAAGRHDDPGAVTGTLVHVGRSVAAALRGAGPWLAALPYLGLWCGLVAGTCAGALVALRSEQAAPLGVPWIEPEDIAPVVVFFASGAARMVTGAMYDVTDGDSANNP